MSKYNFNTHLAPFATRGKNFPDSVLRMRRTSLVISANIAETFTATRHADGERETIRLLFHVDRKKNAIAIEENKRGYALQIRENGNAYLNTTRIDFGLPVADYEYRGELTELTSGDSAAVFEKA